MYCFSNIDKARLLKNLAHVPGGLPEVERCINRTWPLLFEHAYRGYRLLSQASEDGDHELVQKLLKVSGRVLF